jgi:hypothetical protein
MSANLFVLILLVLLVDYGLWPIARMEGSKRRSFACTTEKRPRTTDDDYKDDLGNRLAPVGFYPRAERLSSSTSSHTEAEAIQLDTGQFGGPGLAAGNRKCTRQRSRGHDLAGGKRWINLIAGQNIDQMAQCRQRSTQ